MRKLHWGDTDLAKGRVVWRAENDKRRRRADFPLPATLVREITGIAHDLGAGSGAIFAPYGGPAHAVVSADRLAQRLLRAEQHAELPKLDGGVWHPYRRKFATERQHVPIKALMAVGGWKDMNTMLGYMTPPDDAIEAVLGTPEKVFERGGRLTLLKPD